MPRRLGAWSTNVETIICENAPLLVPPLQKRSKSNHHHHSETKRRQRRSNALFVQMPGMHQISNITSLTFDINVDTHDIRWFGERFQFPNLLHLKFSYHKNGTYGHARDAAEMVYMRYPFCASFIENLLQFSLPYLHSLSIKSLSE